MEQKYEEILLSTLSETEQQLWEKVEPKTLWQQAVPVGSRSTGSVLIITAVLQVINWSKHTAHANITATHMSLGRKQHTPITPQAYWLTS